MDPKTKMLDELLPMLAPRSAELHENVSIVEVQDSTHLLELAANPRIRRCLLARLSDTVALIDPGELAALTKILLAEGHMPKTAKGISA